MVKQAKVCRIGNPVYLPGCEAGSPAYQLLVGYDAIYGEAYEEGSELEIAVRNDNGEIEASFSHGDHRTEIAKNLDYLTNMKTPLNKWQLAQLFNYDGASTGLVEHIEQLLQNLPTIHKTTKHWQDFI